MKRKETIAELRDWHRRLSVPLRILLYSCFGGSIIVLCYGLLRPSLRTSELLEAVRNNDCSAARRLLAEGTDPNCYGLADSDSNSFQPLLFIAINHGNAEMVLALLNNGASPNTIWKEHRRISALIYALSSYRQEESIATLLVERGADIHYEMPDGTTALSIAEKEHYDNLIGLLGGKSPYSSDHAARY